MIKSIRIKLFLYFSIFLIVFVGLSILLNVKYLEKYYFYKNKSIFHSTYEYINETYLKQPEILQEIMYNTERNENIISYIVSEINITRNEVRK